MLSAGGRVEPPRPEGAGVSGTTRDDMDARIEALGRVELLQGVDRGSIARFAERCSFQRVGAGEPVISFDGTEHESDRTDAFLVLEGRLVARSRSSDGREVVFATVDEGGLFGEFSAIDGAPRSAEMLAVVPSWVARVSSARLREMILLLPSIGLRMCELLVAKNREMSQRLFEFATLSVQGRILATLHRLALAQGTATGEGGPVEIALPPTQYDIAITAGTNRETVSREMAALARQGVIAYDRRCLSVLDMTALASARAGQQPTAPVGEDAHAKRGAEAPRS